MRRDANLGGGALEQEGGKGKAMMVQPNSRALLAAVAGSHHHLASCWISSVLFSRGLIFSLEFHFSDEA